MERPLIFVGDRVTFTPGHSTDLPASYFSRSEIVTDTIKANSYQGATKDILVKVERIISNGWEVVWTKNKGNITKELEGSHTADEVSDYHPDLHKIESHLTEEEKEFLLMYIRLNKITRIKSIFVDGMRLWVITETNRYQIEYQEAFSQLIPYRIYFLNELNLEDYKRESNINTNN